MEILRGLTPAQQRLVDLADPLGVEFTANVGDDWVAMHTTGNALVVVARGAAANRIKQALEGTL